jgi:hypothetical protein
MAMDNGGFQQIFGEQELQNWLTLDALMLVKEPTEKQIPHITNQKLVFFINMLHTNQGPIKINWMSNIWREYRL